MAYVRRAQRLAAVGAIGDASDLGLLVPVARFEIHSETRTQRVPYRNLYG